MENTLSNLGNSVGAYVPSFVAAVVILVIALLIATVVRMVVRRLAHASNIEQRFNDRRIAETLGQGAFWLILLLALPAILSALGLQNVLQPIQGMLNNLLAYIPNLLGATLILVIGWFVAGLVRTIATSVLARVGFDRVPPRLGFGNAASAEHGVASRAMGTLAFVAILLLVSMEASRVLGFIALTALISTLVVFAGKLLTGAVIFFVGLFLANLASSAILASDAENPRLLARMARFAILFMVAAMALGQMGLAKDIVNLAFGLLLGAVAVAGALAFGIGGRETAGRIVSEMFSGVRPPSLVVPIERKRDVA